MVVMLLAELPSRQIWSRNFLLYLNGRGRNFGNQISQRLVPLKQKCPETAGLYQRCRCCTVIHCQYSLYIASSTRLHQTAHTIRAFRERSLLMAGGWVGKIDRQEKIPPPSRMHGKKIAPHPPVTL